MITASCEETSKSESFFQVERTIAVAVRGKEKDFKTSI